MSAIEILETLKARGFELEPKLKLNASSEPSEDLLKLIQENRDEILALLIPKAVPKLPWQLERLVQAAVAGQLDQARGIPDLNRYVLACGCAYLLGDREQALKDLWQARALRKDKVN